MHSRVIQSRGDIYILGGSAERSIDALGYLEEPLDAFENCLKGEGVDVGELDVFDKKGKTVRRT